MPKPKNKSELLQACMTNYKQLIELIDSYPNEVQQSNFKGKTLNKNIRDVLAHLNEWHLLFFNWYKIGMKGQKPAMPAEGYKWKDMLELNQQIWKDTQDVKLEDIKKEFKKTYKQAIRIIKKHNDEELFTKKKYAWTGSTSLAAYVIANTSSHYAWGYKLIKKSISKQ